MQRFLLVVIAAVALLVAFGFSAGWWTTQPTIVEPGKTPTGEVTTDNTRTDAAAPETGNLVVDNPIANSNERQLVDGPQPLQTHVLRVIIEEIPAASARTAKVTASAFDKAKNRPSQIRDSWQSLGSTSEFDLAPLLAEIAERGERDNVDELEIEVDHPDYLRSKTRVAINRDQETANGRNVYEVRVKLELPEYWPGFSFAVRDANTRAHLRDIEIRAKPGAGMAVWGFNYPEDLLGEGLRSPIVLKGGRDADDPQAAVAHLSLQDAADESPRFVKLAQHIRAGGFGSIVSARAPGYAWGSIALDLSKTEPRELLLRPGSAIDVRLTNVQLARYRALGTRPMLCVYRIRADGGNQYEHFAPLDETLATKGLQLEGLDPGGYRVTVELGGGSWAERPVLAREELANKNALVAGETHAVVLTLTDPPEQAAHATLAGTISLPNDNFARTARLQLYFQPRQRWRQPDAEFVLAELQRTGGARPTWTFRADDLRVGTYRVQLLPFLKVWIVELPADGRESIELAIPELAELTVETVDAQTGKRVALDEFHFRRKQPIAGQKRNDRWRAETVEPGVFRIATVPGDITIWPSGQQAFGFGHGSQHVELTPGRQSLRFELAPPCQIHFDIRIDGKPPRLSDDIWGWIHYGTLECVRAVDHDGRSLGRAGKQLTEVSAPGVYEIDFAGLTKGRFHAIPKRMVSVRRGEPLEVVVELRRK